MERLKYEELEPMSQDYYLKFMQAKAIEFNKVLQEYGLEANITATKRKEFDPHKTPIGKRLDAGFFD